MDPRLMAGYLTHVHAGGIIVHLSLHELAFKVFTLDRAALSAGPSVHVSFPSQHLHVFDEKGDRCVAASA